MNTFKYESDERDKVCLICKAEFVPGEECCLLAKRFTKYPNVPGIELVVVPAHVKCAEAAWEPSIMVWHAKQGLCAE
jgi:hypothetical protein